LKVYTGGRGNESNGKIKYDTEIKIAQKVKVLEMIKSYFEAVCDCVCIYSRLRCD